MNAGIQFWKRKHERHGQEFRVKIVLYSLKPKIQIFKLYLKLKLQSWKINVRDSQSDFYVICWKTPDEDYPKIVETLGIKLNI